MLWILQHVTWTTQWGSYFEEQKKQWICLPVLHHLIYLCGLALLAQFFLLDYWSTSWTGLIPHDCKWDQWHLLHSTTPCGLCMDPLFSKVRRKGAFSCYEGREMMFQIFSKMILYIASIKALTNPHSSAQKITFPTVFWWILGIASFQQ